MPERSFGARVVCEPRNPQSPNRIDIVLVHRLGGNAIRTWTHQNGFWLKWLHEWFYEKKGLENIQISMFGYNADFGNVARRNILGIEDFAKELLDGMMIHYHIYGDVFSLMMMLLTVGSYNIRHAQYGWIGSEKGDYFYM